MRASELERFLHRRLRAGLLAALLSSALHGDARAREFSLAQAVRLAEQQSPALQTMRGEVHVAEARVAGATPLLRDNPVVTLTLGPRSSISGRSLDYGVQVLQQVELAGQRGARIDAAESALQSTTARVDAVRAAVRASVRSQFGRALAMGERLRLANEAQTIAREARSAAQERLSAGAATQLELNTASVELGRAVRDHAEAEGAHIASLAELQFLLGVDPVDPISLVGDLKAASEEVTDSPAKAIQRALAARPELREARAAIESAKAEERLASREWVPSPGFGASFNREEESRATIVQGILSIDLPLFNRNQGMRGMTKARVGLAQAGLAALELRIKRDVVSSLARVRAARAALDGYAEGVVSAMQENMELVTESYRSGKIDFLQLVVLRRQAVEARLGHINALEELIVAQAELDLAIGRGWARGD